MLLVNTFTFVTFISFARSNPVKIQGMEDYLCLDQPYSLKSSSWKEFLESGRFTPHPDHEKHHIRRLKHKLQEVNAIIDFYKDKFTEDVFGDSFEQINEELGDLHYSEVIPEESEVLADNGNVKIGDKSFLEAYSIFQRLAIALEVIINDEAEKKSISSKMWRASNRMVKVILMNLYTELYNRGVDIPAPLPRRTLPETILCLQSEAYKDVRDFLIMRHLQTASQFYLQMLKQNQ